MGNQMVVLKEFNLERIDAWTDIMERAIKVFPFDEESSRSQVYVDLGKIIGGALLKWGGRYFTSNRGMFKESNELELTNNEQIKKAIDAMQSSVFAFIRVIKPWRLFSNTTKWYDAVLSLMKGSDYKKAFERIWTRHFVGKVLNTKTKECLENIVESKMEKKEFQGLKLTIEVPAGGTRKGTSPTGVKWEQKIKDNYGYILNTNSPDGEHLDIWLKKTPKNNTKVYVIHQMTMDGSKYDEDKVMLGYSSAEEAIRAYKDNCVKPEKQYGGMSEFDIDYFKVIAFSAKNSTAILAPERTVEKMRKDNKLPRGIKSPVEVAMVVKEKYDFNTDSLGGVTIFSESGRLYLNDSSAGNLLDKIDTKSSQYQFILKEYMEHNNVFRLRDEYSSFRVINSKNLLESYNEGRYDIEIFNSNGFIIENVSRLNSVQMEDLRNILVDKGLVENSISDDKNNLLLALQHGKTLVDTYYFDSPKWLAEQIERDTGINYFSLLPLLEENVSFGSEEETRSTYLNWYKHGFEKITPVVKETSIEITDVDVTNIEDNPIDDDTIEQPNRPMDDFDRNIALEMAYEWLEGTETSIKEEYTTEMNAILEQDMTVLAKKYGFSSFKPMVNYLIENTSLLKKKFLKKK
jgi:hypothetical protein